jgi:hypothetical protein
VNDTCVYEPNAKVPVTASSDMLDGRPKSRIYSVDDWLMSIIVISIVSQTFNPPPPLIPMLSPY